MRTPHHLFTLALFFTFISVSVEALNVGIQAADTAISVSKECSRTLPPFLRYGKYCGLLYSGCPGEKPCDGLDACCMKHDDCVQAMNNDYLSQKCSQSFIKCIKDFQKGGERSFKGNKCQVDQVIDVISVVMKAALIAGGVLHKP
ncbi:hypothetical protein GOBAR_DD12337 [Gossypium barbadense]|nr:hypothetical protein GOBAR_DD12337 [Gossypium barbadense]